MKLSKGKHRTSHHIVFARVFGLDRVLGFLMFSALKEMLWWVARYLLLQCDQILRANNVNVSGLFFLAENKCNLKKGQRMKTTMCRERSLWAINYYRGKWLSIPTSRIGWQRWGWHLKMNDDNNNKRTYVEEDDSSVKFLAQRLLLYHYFTRHSKDCIRNKNKTFVINSVICFLLSLSATFPKL